MVKRTARTVFTHPDLQPEKRRSLANGLSQEGIPFETRTTPSEAPANTPILDIIHEYFREVGQLDLLLALALEPSNSDSAVIYYISDNIFISDDNDPAIRAAQKNLERYWDYRSNYWNNFELSFVELINAINRATEASWSIHQFVDRMSKPRSRADIDMLALLENFYDSGWKITFVLTSTYHLIQDVCDNTPNLESYNFDPVVKETYDFFRDHGFSICERGHQINCIIRDIHDAHIKAQDIAKNLHKQVEKQESELWILKFDQAPHYPPPSDGEWTVRIIADYYRINERAVTRAIPEKFPALAGGRGKKITLNEQQMKGVVSRLLKRPTIGKKIAEMMK